MAPIRHFKLIYSTLPDRAQIKKDVEKARTQILKFLSRRVHKDFLKFIVVSEDYGIITPNKTVVGTIQMALWSEEFFDFVQKLQKEGKLPLLQKLLGK